MRLLGVGRSAGLWLVDGCLAAARKYDWAGLRSERGLVPRALRRSHRSHRRPSKLSHTETSPCHHVPLEPAASAAAAHSIIHLGLDVHKDSITVAVLQARHARGDDSLPGSAAVSRQRAQGAPRRARGERRWRLVALSRIRAVAEDRRGDDAGSTAEPPPL